MMPAQDGQKDCNYGLAALLEKIEPSPMHGIPTERCLARKIAAVFEAVRRRMLVFVKQIGMQFSSTAVSMSFGGAGPPDLLYRWMGVFSPA